MFVFLFFFSLFPSGSQTNTHRETREGVHGDTEREACVVPTFSICCIYINEKGNPPVEYFILLALLDSEREQEVQYGKENSATEGNLKNCP